MTLDALVRAVEAMDAAVDCLGSSLEAVSSLFSADWSVQICSSHCFLLFLIQNLHSKNVAATITSTPPITPPTMAPIGVDDWCAVTPGREPIFTQLLEAHDEHDPAVIAQVSSLAQDGQEGGPG